MHRIDIAFVSLQVVASVVQLGCVPLIRRDMKKLIVGQERRLAGTHKGEDDSACFLAGVRAVAEAPASGAPAGFAGLLQNAAGNIVKPAVIKTTEPAVLDAPVAQIRAAVRAVQAEQPGPPSFITKEHEILPHDSDRPGRATRRRTIRQPW